eukprot:12506808-Heterocapsa_arctica.AAC.1
MEGTIGLDGLQTGQPGRAITGVRRGRKNDRTSIDDDNGSRIVQDNRKTNGDTHLQRMRCKEEKTKFTHSKQRQDGQAQNDL